MKFSGIYMRTRTFRDNFYRFRRDIRFAIYKNKINSIHLNLGSFRLNADYFITEEYGCNLSAELMMHEKTSTLESRHFFSEDQTNIVIYIRLNAVLKYSELLESISQDFRGVFVIDPMDNALEHRPSWIGPSARWASPHIPNPLQSNGLCIPLGVEELSLMRNGLLRNFNFVDKKSKLVLVGPFAATHQSRSSFENWEGNALINVFKDRLEPNNYANIASPYRFVVCPRGNGIDTHRFWETLYRGSLPIVEISEWAVYFQSHGIPMVLVNSFDDILTWSERHLLNIWQECHKNPVEIESLWPKYWINLIQDL